MTAYEECRRLLREKGQDHLLDFWASLDQSGRERLLRQIGGLDWSAIDAMRALLPGASAREPASSAGAEVTPAKPEKLSISDRADLRAAGEAALRAGQVGAILVAGGQGTRLGFEGPKGTYPIAPVSGASLFEVHSRKVLALNRRYRVTIPFYIMTSEENNADTKSFFEEHGYFGLPSGAVRFFTQGRLPALWPDGRLVLEASDRLFMGPDGHGGILSALERWGILEDMRRRGLTTLFYFQVDNPLVEIAEPVFIGLHVKRGADISLKVCAKRGPEEGLGVVAEKDGRLHVIEYTELTDEQRHRRDAAGELVFKYGSVAIHVFSLRFLSRMADVGLPLHLAFKKVPYCGPDGAPIRPREPNAYKFERFVFDALPFAGRAALMEFDRAEEFAPLKNAEGADSPATVRAAMSEKAARWFAACGVAVPRDEDGRLKWRLEVDPCYAGNAAELRARLPRGFEIRADTLLAV